MKTLKTIILGLIAVVAFNAASAKSINPAKEKITVNYAVSTFVNAIVHGKNAGLNEVIDSNCKFSMLRGTNMLNYDKSQLMELLANTENVQQDCKSKVTINESNADITVVQVDMVYTEFTRTNYVTLTNTSDGWKISNIYSVFKS